MSIVDVYDEIAPQIMPKINVSKMNLDSTATVKFNNDDSMGDGSKSKQDDESLGVNPASETSASGDEVSDITLSIETLLDCDEEGNLTE